MVVAIEAVATAAAIAGCNGPHVSSQIISMSSSLKKPYGEWYSRAEQAVRSSTSLEFQQVLVGRQERENLVLGFGDSVLPNLSSYAARFADACNWPFNQLLPLQFCSCQKTNGVLESNCNTALQFQKPERKICKQYFTSVTSLWHYVKHIKLHW